VGGNVIEANGAWSIVRGVGLIASLSDVEDIVIKSSDGVPVFVRQVGEVEVGEAFRSAALIKGTEEAVGGVIVARAGANARDVIAGVKARILQIQSGLPAGVTLVPFYDRSSLIGRTVDTLRIALLEEVALVTLAHVLFLMHFRSILIVTLPLPLAVLASFLAMRYAGISSNLMSLAGIAIAIGVLVDAGIVVTENAFRSIERKGIDTKDRAAVFAAVRESTQLVGRPVFFSMAIITEVAGETITPLMLDDAIHAALGLETTLEQWQLNGDSLLVVDPVSRHSAAVAAQAVSTWLARPIRGERVGAIAPEASGKYRLVKR
jgi:Cu(I)/Ag(I) efflux system membrane protein CusA/SilA